MTKASDKPEAEFQMVTVKDIAQMLAMSAAHVRDRVVRRNDFPKPYRIGGARRWLRAEVFEWLEAKQ